MKIISLKNINTNEDLFKVDSQLQVEVVEVANKSLVLEIPQALKIPPRKILLVGFFDFKEEKTAFQFIGQVVSNEVLDGVHRVAVDLTQYDKQLWVQFLRQKEEKQGRADHIFRLIKGDG